MGGKSGDWGKDEGKRIHYCVFLFGQRNLFQGSMYSGQNMNQVGIGVQIDGDLSLPEESCLNPPTFLWKGERNKSDIERNCLELIEYQTKVRTYLEDVLVGKEELFSYRWILKNGAGEEVQ